MPGLHHGEGFGLVALGGGEEGDLPLPEEDPQALDVVRVLVGDEYARELVRLHPRAPEGHDRGAGREAAVDEDV